MYLVDFSPLSPTKMAYRYGAWTKKYLKLRQPKVPFCFIYLKGWEEKKDVQAINNVEITARLKERLRRSVITVAWILPLRRGKSGVYGSQWAV